MKKQIILFAITMMFTVIAKAQTYTEKNASLYFDSIKSDPKKLRSFLYDMPKGGDLHNHQSGATYAENLIEYGKNDGLCLDPKSYVVSKNENCVSDNLLTNVILDSEKYNQIIDAWSMRNFMPVSETGHDHFFATFSKFGAITGTHRGEILAEIAERAEQQNESYLELMVTADGNQSGRLGKKLGWSSFEQMRHQLLAANFSNIINNITASLNEDENKKRSILACDSNQPRVGCHIKIRYLYQVSRAQAPEMVFAQLLAGFEAASHDKRVVGLNMVAPEDGFISMRDYKLHMQMIAFLRQYYPNVYVSLHAGELTNAIVNEEGLKFHIYDAVNVALANRIGHGVDVEKEDHSEELLNDMAKRHILVEINLTSNSDILNVEGKNHPLAAYLKHNVPVTLSTDDEGVSRGNLTNEYVRAVTTYQFDYPTLKKFARASLAYSFLPGQSLWQDDEYHSYVSQCQKDTPDSETISNDCQAFLNENEKAEWQWDLERRFIRFESQF